MVYNYTQFTLHKATLGYVEYLSQDKKYRIVLRSETNPSYVEATNGSLKEWLPVKEPRPNELFNHSLEEAISILNKKVREKELNK